MKKLLTLLITCAAFNAFGAGAGLELTQTAQTKSQETPADVIAQIKQVLNTIKAEQLDRFRLGQIAYPLLGSAGLSKEQEESRSTAFAEYARTAPQQSYVESALQQLEKFLPTYNETVVQELRQAFPGFEVQHALYIILSTDKLTEEQKWNFFDVLIKAGASVNSKEGRFLNGQLPLNFAINARLEKAVSKLLQAGASLDRGYEAKTPLELALENVRYWKDTVEKPSETRETAYQFFPGGSYRGAVVKGKSPQEIARDKEILAASERILNIIRQAQEERGSQSAAAAAVK